MLEKMVLKKRRWNATAKDNVAKLVLKPCCKRQCFRRCCWSGVVETLFQKITTAFVASKWTSTFFFLCFFFHSCSLVKKIITNIALVFIFYCPCKITTEDDDKCNARHRLLQPKKKNLDVGFFGVARDDDEPPNSSSSLKQILCRQTK